MLGVRSRQGRSVSLGCRDAPVLAAPYHSVRTRMKADGVLFVVQAHHGSVEKSTGDYRIVAAGLLVVDHPVACEAESILDRVHQSAKGTWTSVNTTITVETVSGVRHACMLRDYEGDYVNSPGQRLLSLSLGDEWNDKPRPGHGCGLQIQSAIHGYWRGRAARHHTSRSTVGTRG
jgi:hypothetical protein